MKDRSEIAPGLIEGLETAVDHARGSETGRVIVEYGLYTEVLGGESVLVGEPSIVALANGWVIINVGGGPTEDKPSVTLETPADPDRTSSFLNIRVADIQAVYAEWSQRGAEFLTPPQDRGAEIRCYIRDPDRHLIEVGQTTRAL